MPKVWCAEIECKHNKNNLCRQKEINLSDGYIHTTHQGYLRVWCCKNYELSEEFKKLMEELKKQFPVSAKEEAK